MFDVVDKAESQKYYIEVLHKEIHSSSTFQPTHLTEEPIVNEHLNVSTQLKATSDNMTVPTTWWLLKLRKTSYKIQFISVSS